MIIGMWKFKLKKIGLISLLINLFVPKKMLFQKKSSDTIYFAYIDPKEVCNTSYIPESSNYLTGSSGVFGEMKGWWNNLFYNFEKNILYQLSNEVIRDEKNEVYNYISKKHSEKEAKKIWNKLKKLYQSLQADGYLSQYELKNLDRTIELGKYTLPKNETFIALNKNGKFIRLFSGRHRLALAQKLEIKEIPVIITLSHPDAKKFLPKKYRIITGREDDFRPF